jgi:phosphoglucosamine mutase
MSQLFGTDGVRGVANAELSPELALGLGGAVVTLLCEEGVSRPRVAVGRDPRASGEMLEAALTAGVCSAGGDVTPLGVIPTPGVAYLADALGVDSAAMISASHNPVADNGIKFFGPSGYKLTDAEEARVAEVYTASGLGEAGHGGQRPVGAEVGGVRPAGEAVERYVSHLVDSATADLSGLRVVVDCANGAASHIAPEVLARLGCEVTAVHASPDGANINDGCGSTAPEALAATVVSHGADVGLAHDGDADRLIAVDHTGGIVDGDVVLAILAERFAGEHGLHTVVTTLMTNLGFRHAMSRLGIEVVETKVGDRYVLEAMRAGGYTLGGEPSGHLILSDYATTGDGLLTAIALLSTMVRQDAPLATLAAVMRHLPQALVNVEGVDRKGLDDADGLWAAVAAEEAALGEEGRVLVRPSGTEPLVRIMVEAETEPRAHEAASRLATVTREAIGTGAPR